MKHIELTQGFSTIVDDADFDRLSGTKWCVSILNKRYPYATARIDGRNVLMHRYLLGSPVGMVVDHISSDTLDNRMSNLRVCTKSENCCNATRKRDSFSQYKGVSWHKKTKKWVSRITKDGITKHLGYFHDEVSAAEAYDVAAVTAHGVYAKTNL